MEFETWSAINEAQKKDELFHCDKQDYEFEHVTINKKQKKNKKKFDLDNMNLDGDNQQEKPAGGAQQQAGEAASGENQTDDGSNAPPKAAQGGGGEGPCELPDEVLSDSEEEAEQPASLKKEDYKTAAQEKPMDTFKSLYSEFKEFIPDSMKPKDERGQPNDAAEARPRNVSFLNKAKGFFGL